MSEFSLSSLLPKGTKTQYNSEYKTTINLILALEELKEAIVKCVIYSIEYRLDYYIINTTFNILILVL